ncbi:MAG TPA: hypothetical protein VFL98_02555 [Candidatus Paceibacterota bacterium]|nr:hypothetical protein [Candidatus Paceibacterota bacterium]
MDPQTSTIGMAPAPAAALSAPDEAEESPLRILEILREPSRRAPLPARAVGAPAGVPLPEVARPLAKESLPRPQEAASIPTLADLGGTRPLGERGIAKEDLAGPAGARDPLHPAAGAAREREAAELSELAQQELAGAGDPAMALPGDRAAASLTGAAVPDTRGVIAPPARPDTPPRFAGSVDMQSIALPDADAEQPHTQFPTAIGSRSENAVTAAPAPAPAPPQAPDIPSIHTLRDDMQRIMRSQSISVVKAAALEERKKQARAKQALAKPARKHGPMLAVLITSLILLALAGALGGGFLWYRAIRQAPLSVEADAPSAIFAEQTTQLSLTDTSPTVIMAELAKLKGASLPASSITRVIPTVTASTTLGANAAAHAATTKQFLDAIGAQAPAELTSALGDDLFLGVHAIDGNQAVLIIPVTSYEHAFAGMLDWEPRMGKTLAGLFPGAPSAIAAASASSTSGFSDIVIKNYDVRMLADQSGQPVLFYSFPTRNWLVITSSPYTFTEVLARLQAAGALQAAH